MNRHQSFGSLIACLVLCSCSPSASSDVSDAFVERAIIAACEALVADYAIARDRPDPEAYANTFALDGRLILPSVAFIGRDNIRNRLQRSAGQSRSRHFMSNVRVQVVSDTEATGIAYAVIYEEDIPTGQEASQPIPTAGPFAIGEYHDRFVLTDEGWKFSERRFVAAFVVEDN